MKVYDHYPKFLTLLILLWQQPDLSSGIKIKLVNNAGFIQGRVANAKPSGKSYASFTGIPYAEPPLGQHRFKAPEAKSAWEGVFDATKDPVQCLQLALLDQKQDPQKVLGTEDCLVLNVYAPLLNQNELPVDLPVMVWIHGGGFVVGDAGPDLHGPDYFMTNENVILVTLNYRLGILGFLSLGDDVIAGNMGLKDQTLALKWVRENIKSFGGDPEKVTIFGESAGGASVMAHILSPYSKGLFQKAIIQSGKMSDLRNLIPSHPPEYFAKRVLEDLEPEDDLEQMNSLQLLQLLQKMDAAEIIRRNALFEEFRFTRIPWKPIVDKFASKPFIPDDPKILLSEGDFNKVPVMTGGNQDEGCVYMTQFLANEDLFQEVGENFDTKGPLLFLNIAEEDVTEEDSATVHLIKNEYLDGLHTNFTIDNWQRIARIFGDIIYLVPIDIEARSMVEKSDQPVFYYRNKYKAGLTLPMLSDSYEDKLKAYDFGVCHADDLFLLFRPRILMEKVEKLNEEDEKMVKKMVHLWTSFATDGRPDDPQWQPLAKDNHKWAVINKHAIKMQWDEDFEHKVEFIRSMFEVLVGYRNMNFQDHPAVKAMLEYKMAQAEQEEPIDLESVENKPNPPLFDPELMDKIHEEL